MKFCNCHLLVNFRFVFYLFGRNTKSQWWDRLWDIIWMRRASNNKSCFWITTQWLLKYSCKFTVSVRNVCWFSIRKCINYFTQSSQTCIDFFCFIQCFTFSPCFPYFLAACQIDKIQSSSFCTEIFQIILTDCDYKKHVWSWWSFIHIGGCNCSAISGFFDQLVNLFRRRNIIFSQIFNKNPSLFIRSYL